MNLTFYDTLLYFQWICMLASAIFSIRLIGNRRIPKYMNNFFWYSLVGGLLTLFDLSQKYIGILSRMAYGFLDATLLIFHFIFLSLFIYRILPNKTVSKHLKLLFFLFLMVILFCLCTSDLSKPPAAAYAISNFGLVLFCCIYYLGLFWEMPTINLLKESSFWVVSGIFFCMCATVPIYSLRAFLFDQIPYSLFLSMGSIGFFVYGVMHLFFIKAYLCSTSQPKA